MRSGRGVTVGYKYHHISNAGRGINNPGFDNNLFTSVIRDNRSYAAERYLIIIEHESATFRRDWLINFVIASKSS